MFPKERLINALNDFIQKQSFTGESCWYCKKK